MALTKRYVRSDAAGGGDGTTNTNSGANGAFTWAEMITDINTPRAGYKYLVKSGTYANGTTTTTLTGDGSTTSPNVIEGFNATEGDLIAQGRTSGGALDTANFPVISYTGTTAKFDASGATHLVLRCLNITSAASAATLDVATNSRVTRCKVDNSSSNASAAGITATGAGADLVIIDCDVGPGVSGAAHGIRTSMSNANIIGCRVKWIAGNALRIRSTVSVQGCTLYESGIGINCDLNSSNNNRIFGNTIVNNTGDGIDVATGTTGAMHISGNHITGNGGYGIDFNTSTCVKMLGFNRMRDNSSGDINGGGDWEEGTSLANITSDDTDAIDYVDQANDNYLLKSAAPAATGAPGYRVPMGGNGVEQVAPTFSTSSGRFGVMES